MWKLSPPAGTKKSLKQAILGVLTFKSYFDRQAFYLAVFLCYPVPAGFIVTRILQRLATMKKRSLRKQELAYVVTKSERDTLGREAPIHVVRTHPTDGTTSATACCRPGPFQFFMPFLWWMSKNPGTCKTCLDAARKELAEDELPSGLV